LCLRGGANEGHNVKAKKVDRDASPAARRWKSIRSTDMCRIGVGAGNV
jgi:hypothetical protein